MALLTTILTFVYWLLVGLGLVRWARPLPTPQLVLLAPALGASAVVVVAATLSRLGLPLGAVALPASALLLTAALGGWVRSAGRPAGLGTALRACVPFLAPAAVAVALVAGPLWRYGFGWMSYANGDMVFYASSAWRLLHHGFYAAPDWVQVALGRESGSVAAWSLMVRGHRAGSELLLAVLSGVTGLSPDRAYMPLMVAGHVMLISAGSALVYTTPARRWAALATGGLCALSPALTYGLVNQLLAQVLGLTFLIAGVVFVLPSGDLLNERPWRRGLIGAFPVAAMVVTYPEIAVFPIAAVALSGLTMARWRRHQWRSWSTGLATAGVGALVLAHRGVLDSLLFMRGMATRLLPAAAVAPVHLAGTDAPRQLTMGAGELFPYLLIPNGLANLWGMQAFAQQPAEPWNSLAVGMAAVLSVLALGTSVWLTREGDTGGTLLAVCGAVLICLVALGSGFGSFKTSMYIQPFLLGGCVCGLLRVARGRRWVVVAGLLLLVLPAIPTLGHYLARAYGTVYGTYAQVPPASAGGLMAAIRGALVQVPPQARVATEAYEPSLAGLETLCLDGRRVVPLSWPLRPADCSSGSQGLNLIGGAWYPHQLVPEALSECQSYRVAAAPWLRRGWLVIADGAGLRRRFRVAVIGDSLGPSDYLLATPPSLTILNRRDRAATGGTDQPVVRPWGELQDHLIARSFDVEADPEQAGEVEDRFPMNLEPDPFGFYGTMCGVGRYLVLQVVGATAPVRLTLTCSASFQRGARRRLPQAWVVGDQPAALPLIGAGSARVVSPPLYPALVSGIPVVVLDLGRPGQPAPASATGVARLYGRQYSLDRRRTALHLRELSVISADRYGQGRAPVELAHLPGDLGNPDLEYSGIYEDGWLSPEATFGLQEPAQGARLRVAFMVPQVRADQDSAEVEVLAAGRIIDRRRLALGASDYTLDWPVGPNPQGVGLRFLTPIELPEGDGREVGAYLTYLGFGVDRTATGSH